MSLTTLGLEADCGVGSRRDKFCPFSLRHLPTYINPKKKFGKKSVATLTRHFSLVQHQTHSLHHPSKSSICTDLCINARSSTVLQISESAYIIYRHSVKPITSPKNDRKHVLRWRLLERPWWRRRRWRLQWVWRTFQSR